MSMNESQELVGDGGGGGRQRDGRAGGGRRRDGPGGGCLCSSPMISPGSALKCTCLAGSPLGVAPVWPCSLGEAWVEAGCLCSGCCPDAECFCDFFVAFLDGCFGDDCFDDDCFDDDCFDDDCFDDDCFGGDWLDAGCLGSGLVVAGDVEVCCGTGLAVCCC